MANYYEHETGDPVIDRCDEMGHPTTVKWECASNPEPWATGQGCRHCRCGRRGTHAPGCTEGLNQQVRPVSARVDELAAARAEVERLTRELATAKADVTTAREDGKREFAQYLLRISDAAIRESRRVDKP